MPSANWGTRRLQDSFQDSLEAALSTAVAAGKLAGVVSSLTDAFTAMKSGTASRSNQWSLALLEGRKVETFTVMREEITELLEQKSASISSVNLQSADYADIIVGALAASLAEEADREPKRNLPPENILYSAMIPVDVKRIYNARLFLVFFGMIAFTVITYGVIEPSYWLNPASGTLVLLGYTTLVTTAVVHEHAN
jgi:hypothetical protein